MTKLIKKNRLKILTTISFAIFAVPSSSYAIPFSSAIDRLSDISSHIAGKVEHSIVSGLENSLGIDIHDASYYYQEIGSKAKSKFSDSLRGVSNSGRSAIRSLSDGDFDSIRKHMAEDVFRLNEIQKELQKIHNLPFDYVDHVADRAKSEIENQRLLENPTDGFENLIVENSGEIEDVGLSRTIYVRVPEPATYTLLLVAVFGIAARRFGRA